MYSFDHWKRVTEKNFIFIFSSIFNQNILIFWMPLYSFLVLE